MTVPCLASFVPIHLWFSVLSALSFKSGCFCLATSFPMEAVGLLHPTKHSYIESVSKSRRNVVVRSNAAPNGLPAIGDGKHVSCLDDDDRREFATELQLKYRYLIEIRGGRSLNISSLERALRGAISSQLLACMDGTTSQQNNASFAVGALSSSQTFSTFGFCLPSTDINNTCHVMEGSTSLFLNGNVDDVKSATYRVVTESLRNTTLLSSISADIVNAGFLCPVSKALSSPTLNPPSSGGSASMSASVKVYIAAGSALFVVVLILTLGRRASTALRTPQSPLRSAGRLGIRMGEYFQRGEDDSDGSGSSRIRFPVMIDGGEGPSANWSVSDITSDCSSRSATSTIHTKNSTRLERIEEEEATDHKSVVQPEEAINKQGLSNNSIASRHTFSSRQDDSRHGSSDEEACNDVTQSIGQGLTPTPHEAFLWSLLDLQKNFHPVGE